MEQFSGPLDLLLSLIKDNKCDISSIALSEVTEQYLQYLDKLEENKDEELADFLVVGTKLLFLKSRMLLPQFAPAEEEGESLEQQLKLYKAFVDASRKVNKLWLNHYRSIFRIEPPRKSMEFVAPTNLSAETMHASLLHLLKRLRPLKALPQTQIDRAISLKERIDRIRRLISESKKIDFFSLLENSQNRTEVIVSFLALLELVKQKTIMFTQESTFSDISIEKI